MQQERLKKLLAEAAQTTVSGPLALDPQAVSILTEYAEEITSRILESAILLSQAKGAQVIEDADIALLLAKKLGEEVAGKEVAHPLHHQTVKSSLSAALGTIEESEQQVKKKSKVGAK